MQIIKILSGSNTLTEYTVDFVYPNSIAADEEKKILFDADFSRLHVIDLITEDGVTDPNNILSQCVPLNTELFVF